jgi:6-hydroxynicotinate 3-monooxygenase
MNRRNEPRIAVVGAGLGGTVAAAYLQRFGYTVDVYEQAARLERIGAGISLSPNVTRIFRDMGLLQRMQAVGILPRERHRRDGITGELTFAVPVDELPERYGAPQLIMHRGDLLDILASAVAPESIHLGKRLLDVGESGTSLRLTFADGSSAEADIVIGADGINSRVRQTAFAVKPPFYAGEVAHRSIYPRELLGGEKIADHTKYWGEDRHILVYFITHDREVVYFITGVPQPEWPHETFAPVPTGRDELRAAFAAFCPDVRRILDAAPAATTWPICESDPAPGWSAGRIVLLGDACHAMQPHMGQGAAMAMEDAVVLARCIDRYGAGDPARSFALYEALRFDRATKIQTASRGNPSWMRFGMDTEWLYGYDAVAMPLEPSGSSSGTRQTS